MNFLLVFLSIFGSSTPEVIRKPGLITYSDEGGKMQCTSQIDPNGHIVVLLESKKDNTTFKLLQIEQDGETYLLKVLYKVQKYPDGLRANVFMREVAIPIQPVRTNEITLKGRPIFESLKIDVMTTQSSLSEM